MAVIEWDCADDDYRKRAYSGMAADIERLQDEVSHLRAALREAVDIAAGSGADFTWQANERLTELRQIADGLYEQSGAGQ